MTAGPKRHKALLPGERAPDTTSRPAARGTGATGDAEVERIAGYPVHPAASAFPLMAASDLATLAENIDRNGQLEPAVTYQGQLLDGRHRGLACDRLGRELVVVEWDGAGGTPAAFVVARNLERRHMTAKERAWTAAKFRSQFEIEALLRQAEGRQLGGINRAKGRAGVVTPRNGGKQPTTYWADQAAAAAGVSRGYVEQAGALQRDEPEIAKRVDAGEIDLGQAVTLVRRREQRAAIARYEAPVGRFPLIVTDPPWRFDVRPDDETHRGKLDYPTMSIEELCAMPVPAADDCWLFCWVTCAHLVDGGAASVVKAWGFEAKTLWTWVKVAKDGGQRLLAGGYGRGGTEHLIVAKRGRPLGDFDSVPNWFEAPLREHSRKPNVLYERVAKCCPYQQRLEMFAREQRVGWVISGAESGKFEPALVSGEQLELVGGGGR